MINWKIEQGIDNGDVWTQWVSTIDPRKHVSIDRDWRGRDVFTPYDGEIAMHSRPTLAGAKRILTNIIKEGRAIDALLAKKATPTATTSAGTPSKDKDYK